MKTAIRLVLMAGLLVLVYGETGPWTVGVLAGMSVAHELTAYVLRRDAR